MIRVSEAYKQACESNERISYIVAKFGLYDKNAKSSVSVSESNSQPFSNVANTYNEIKETKYNYISCEPDRVKLDGTFYFVSDKTTPNTNEKLAYWSNELSNENGTFATNPKIVYVFSKEIAFTDLTLYFQEVCSDLKVYYYLNSSLISTRTITDNTSLEMVTSQVSRATSKFNKLVIEFIKTGEPYRYIKFNEVDFGVYQSFSKDQITDIDIIDELSIDSSELSSNSLTLNIDDSNGKYDILNPNNELNLLQEKQEITIYHNLKVGNSFKEVPLGTFLLKNFKVSNQQLIIECYDDIYFMNKIYYGSKFYNNTEVSIILKDLFNYFDYTRYIIDDELQGIKLTGYLPNLEFRECLRLVAEASGCVVNKNRYGETYLFKTYDPSVKTFTRRNIFAETPSRNLFNNVIDIYQYDYSSNEENKEIYNSKLSKGLHTVVYSDYPVYENSVVKAEENSDYEIITAYATTCVVNVLTEETTVKLNATLIIESKSVKRIKKDKDILVDEYAITKVDNNLITTNYEEIAKWKLHRSDVTLNFDTMVTPYIEVGDTCKYTTKFGQVREFIPTRLEFTKSIKQNIEGE